MKRVDFDAGYAKVVIGTRRPPFSADAIGGCGEPAERLVGWNRHTFPDCARTEAPQHDSRPADVIGVGVCQHERVERTHAKSTERARHDSLAEVESGPVPWILERSRRQAAGVDEEAASIGKDDQRCITLADVKKHDAQPATRRRRYAVARRPLGRHDDDRAEEGRGSGRGP